MKKIEEVRDYLLANRVNKNGDLDLIGLDFSDFNGDVLLIGMKVKRDLWQKFQKVGGDLMQGGQKVEGSLWQSKSTVQGNYICRGIEVGGNIFAEEPTKILKKVTKEELAEMGYEVI